ncbi:MAG: Uncharacterised protein [Porticoccaceae bacterium UBA1117]|nr:MAG: Uncharacterised protein [Porticoccaceae bacterium UBA1117]
MRLKGMLRLRNTQVSDALPLKSPDVMSDVIAPLSTSSISLAIFSSFDPVDKTRESAVISNS